MDIVIVTISSGNIVETVFPLASKQRMYTYNIGCSSLLKGFNGSLGKWKHMWKHAVEKYSGNI